MYLNILFLLSLAYFCSSFDNNEIKEEIRSSIDKRLSSYDQLARCQFCKDFNTPFNKSLKTYVYDIMDKYIDVDAFRNDMKLVKKQLISEFNTKCDEKLEKYKETFSIPDLKCSDNQKLETKLDSYFENLTNKIISNKDRIRYYKYDQLYTDGAKNLNGYINKFVALIANDNRGDNLRDQNPLWKTLNTDKCTDKFKFLTLNKQFCKAVEVSEQILTSGPYSIQERTITLNDFYYYLAGIDFFKLKMSQAIGYNVPLIQAIIEVHADNLKEKLRNYKDCSTDLQKKLSEMFPGFIESNKMDRTIYSLYIAQKNSNINLKQFYIGYGIGTKDMSSDDVNVVAAMKSFPTAFQCLPRHNMLKAKSDMCNL